MIGKGRAFCAGGDVAAVVRDISGGRPFSFTVIVPCNWKLGAEYFWNEFTLNYLMATYSKTQVSILNGIVMGGGAGASIHGRFRVATENSVFAMPETALGLFPDVGASYYLSRLPGFFVSSSQVLEKADLSSFIPLQSFQEELTPIFQEKPRLCAQTPTNNNIRLLLTSTQVLLQNDPKTPQNPHLIFQHQHCPFQHVNRHKICNYLHIGDGRYVQTMRELDFIGEYVGLTGARLDGAEMLACGLATHFVPSERLTSLEEALHKVDSGDSMVVSAIIEEFSLLPTLKEKSAYHRLDIIDRCFSRRTIEEILSALESEAEKSKDDWLSLTIQALKKASPTSLKISLRSIREGRLQGVGQCLVREYRMVCCVMRGKVSKDFFEGCRALLLDKDKNPKWEPSRLDLITDSMVDSYFSKVDDDNWRDLKLPARSNLPVHAIAKL
ncbi:hypothetical protein RJ640_024148 [Escallonia rubra]|uniref:3-hydroxyisobutyryl-CoA hydrolase n=1 Tax=Escallonia rubra TaxID=112253 RepID=A0AA88UCB1_9ASTE|nr:hypothetical protein RJ640_024148 [Escallonia rubra]